MQKSNKHFFLKWENKQSWQRIAKKAHPCLLFCNSDSWERYVHPNSLLVFALRASSWRLALKNSHTLKKCKYIFIPLNLKMHQNYFLHYLSKKKRFNRVNYYMIIICYNYILNIINYYRWHDTKKINRFSLFIH